MALTNLLRSLWRSWRRNPATTVLAVVALGLGIGATASMFAIVDGVLRSPLPFPEPDRLVSVELVARGATPAGINGSGVPARDFLDWREAQTSFSGLAATTFDTVNLSDPGVAAERYETARVTADLFAVLGVEPALGRGFAAGDERIGAPPVAVLAHGLWQQRYDGDPAIVGRTIRLDGTATEVVGVMPPGFTFPTSQKLWRPLALDPSNPDRRAGGEVWVVGRLRDGVALAAAKAEMATISGRVAERHPETNRDLVAVVRDYRASLNSAADEKIIPLLMAGVSLVLGIACANVAGLLVARAAARAHEMALRAALGAGRMRVLARGVVESLGLSLPGALVGLGVARLATAWITESFQWKNLPYWISFEVTPRVALFVVGAGLASGLLAAIAPALRAAGGGGFDLLKDQARGGSSARLGRLGRGLVVAELALAAALVSTAGLMVRSAVNYRSLSPGFETRSILTASVTLPETTYRDEAASAAFFERLVTTLRARPEVEAAALMSRPPGSYMGTASVRLASAGADLSAKPPEHPRGVVDPDFFALYRIRPLEGRVFAADDDADAPLVVVVNASFAATSWPGEEAVGQRLRLDDDPEATWRTVVGVVPDAGVSLLNPELASSSAAGLYVPYAQDRRRTMSFAVKTRRSPEAFVATLREVVRDLDPTVPIDPPRTMERVVWEQSFPTQITATLFGGFGAIALVLAALGVFAITSAAVAQQTTEIGVRMALGARPRDVLRQVLAQAAGRLAVALGIGFALAFGLSSALTAILYGVEPSDPLAAGIAALVLAAAALAATLGPALAASRIDPLAALRQG